MEPKHPPDSPAQDLQCPRLSPPSHRFLRLIVMYYLLTSATTLARRGFLHERLRTAAMAVTGSRSGRMAGRGAPAAQGGRWSRPQPRRRAARRPWRHPGCSLPAPFLPCTAISPAVPALTLISPLPQAMRGCAQRASRFSFFLKLFLFRLSFLNLISR